MPRVDLNGKAIAITGASSGIGKATALACARAGMPVTIAARRRDKLQALAAEIEDLGGKVHIVEADVSSEPDCQAVIDQTVSHHGSIYAAFANAGYAFERDIMDTPDQMIRDLFEVNFWGSLWTIRAAVRAITEQSAHSPSGHVLMCSSCLSHLPIPWHAPYTASKAMQFHFSRALQVELAQTGIHVSTVHPIGTRSELRDRMREVNEGKDVMAGHSNARFMQSAEHVANCIVRGLRRPRPEIWTSRPARLLFAATALAPNTTKRILTRMSLKRFDATT